MCSDHCSVTELDSQIPDDYTSWKTIEITAVALVDAVFAKESHGDDREGLNGSNRRTYSMDKILAAVIPD